MSITFSHHLAEHRALFALLDALAPQIDQASTLLSDCLRRGGKLMFCGNGGSAADSQHLASEFTGRFVNERRPLAAMALCTDSSQLSSIGNDYGFDQVFERPLRGLGRPGDVLVAISTSGQSVNVQRAVQAARQIGISVIGLLGRDGGVIASACDVPIIVPHQVTARIQEAHIFIGHVLCAAVEAALLGFEADPAARMTD